MPYDPRHWASEGACQGTDPEAWFSELGNSMLRRWLAEICESCPVTDQCLQWALKHDETGYWGGTSQHQRDKMTGRRRRGLPPERARSPNQSNQKAS